MHERRLVVIAAGLAASGKGETCEYMHQKHDFVPVSVSGIIKAYANEVGLELKTRSDYRTAHQRMKQLRGKDNIAQTISQTPGHRIVVDGLRVPNDIARLRQVGSNLCKVIALHCPDSIRFQRAVSRGHTLDKLSFSEFLADEQQDTYDPNPEYPNTNEVMDAADFHIDASQPLTVVQAELDRIIVPLL